MATIVLLDSGVAVHLHTGSKSALNSADIRMDQHCGVEGCRFASSRDQSRLMRCSLNNFAFVQCSLHLDNKTAAQGSGGNFFIFRGDGGVPPL